MTSSTRDLLNNNNIRSAVVVDDAYDLTPSAADLRFDREEKDIFVDDLTNDDTSMLKSVYPGYVPGRESQLFLDDTFIACLWNARDQFRPEHIDPLFHTYIHDSEHDLRVVRVVEDELKGLDLSVRTSGRAFADAAAAVDLIVIDLFLGAQQDESDVCVSIDGLAEVVKQRLDKPPVIILMSRSGQLPVQAERFRNDARVFASGFRTIAKSDIEKPGRLEHLVRELARHRQDSLKLNSFLQRWTEGLSDAIRRTQDDIRRLDLEDWARIRELLLKAEESSAGRYILEVLELAFLHELESAASFLAAAAALDTLERETYPPTTIVGSKDTLGLVAKTLYEHENCRQLDLKAAAPVAFGEIIGLIQGSEFPGSSVYAQLDNAVLITMTPGCDLQRGDAARILFMVGETRDLDVPTASEAPTGLHTPILNLPDGKRVWICWQPHHLLTLTSGEVDALLSTAENSVTKLARLRIANAVSLQQQLLSDLGRVGLVAPMPSTFPVQVAIYYPSPEGELTPLLIDGKETIDAVCYVGRRSNHKDAQAPFDSIYRFACLETLENLADGKVHGNSVQAVKKARDVEVLDMLFSRGLRFNPAKKDPQDCKAWIAGEEFSIGKVVYRQPASQVFAKRNQINGAGLVFEIRGLPLSSGG